MQYKFDNPYGTPSFRTLNRNMDNGLVEMNVYDDPCNYSPPMPKVKTKSMKKAMKIQQLTMDKFGMLTLTDFA